MLDRVCLVCDALLCLAAMWQLRKGSSLGERRVRPNKIVLGPTRAIASVDGMLALQLRLSGRSVSLIYRCISLLSPHTLRHTTYPFPSLIGRRSPPDHAQFRAGPHSALLWCVTQLGSVIIIPPSSHLVWAEMPRLELVASPPAHVEPAWAVAFNPKRNILASCSTDKTIRLYSFNLPLSPSHTHTPRQACAHDHAAPSLPSSTSQKPSVHFQQSLTTEHKRTVRSISWSPTGLTLASGSFDSTVGLWAEIDPDAEDEGEGVFKPASNGQDVDMDGEGGIEGREQKEWECVTTLEGHESECKAVAWSSDGALLASCSRDKSVWVCESESSFGTKYRFVRWYTDEQYSQTLTLSVSPS